MFTRFREWLRALKLDDPLQHQQGKILQVVLLGWMTLNIITIPIVFLSPNVNISQIINGLIVQFLGIVSSIVALILLRNKHIIKSVYILTIGTVILVTILLIPRGMNSSWISFFLYSYPITFAGLIGTRRLLWSIIGLIIIAVITISILGDIAPTFVAYNTPHTISSVDSIVSYSIAVIILGAIFDSFGPILRELLKSSQQSEIELKAIRDNQESIINEQTKHLQKAIADIEQREIALKQTLTDLRNNQAIVRELSAPVIPVLPGVLVTPLVGAIDSDRASILTHSVLQMIEQSHAHSVIFDITGVPIVDSHVAQVLITTANAIRLLGAQVLLVGMRPEVAQTMVALHVDLSIMVTFASLREAVESLLPESGWRRRLEFSNPNE